MVHLLCADTCHVAAVLQVSQLGAVPVPAADLAASCADVGLHCTSAPHRETDRSLGGPRQSVGHLTTRAAAGLHRRPHAGQLELHSADLDLAPQLGALLVPHVDSKHVTFTLTSYPQNKELYKLCTTIECVR